MPRASSHFVALSIARALYKLGSVVASPALRTATTTVSVAPEEPGSTTFWVKLLLSCGLVLLGGVFAGLTIGLMGLDELHLRVLAMASDEEVEKKNAAKVLKLLRKGRHWVLVVLLLGNVIVNESLPIFLDSAIGGGIAAVAISTALIGEQAAVYIWPPIAWPIAKLLDYVLGADEEHTYKKAELRSFLQFHRQGEEPLRDDEIKILSGVLELNTKSVVQIMTPMRDAVTLSADAVLDHALVDKILISGYSRFPVHEPGKPHAYIGLLLIKKLLKYDPALKLQVSEFGLSILPEATPEINCFQALDYFQTGRAHLLLVSKTPGIPGGALGVVTLEDIIEEIIAEEIVDEFDRYEDNHSKKAAKRRGNAAVMKGIVEHVKRRATVTGVRAADEPEHEYDTESAPLLNHTSTGDGASINTTEGESRASTPGQTYRGKVGRHYGATLSTSPRS
ncbi:hypothetical protein EW145_g1236 [Phellinidium pouzarii]|uniref:CNNM transmembrane domain-containing protein n=1 Tax=Phellinidium pouzarii TaxID=167371 RepID=A0A4S4LFB2_9AGAM|nr:hypothetical protein EW145_g1236 [Phellinidium pouzarii]